MAALFFIYGLAFFILGLTVAIYPKKHSKFWLAHNVWLIATFAILHGLNEWAYLLIIIQKPIDIPSLQLIKSFLLPVSFIFLLQFGVKCIIDLKNKSPILKAVPVILLITWAIIVSNSNQRFLMADIWARYLLAVPGTLLTAYALMLQFTEIKKVGLSRPIIYLKLSAIGFLFYGFFAGLVVPNDHFSPAAILNYTVVAETTGLQVQVFRTFCALVIAFGLIKVLSIFEWETIEALRTSRDEIELEVKQRTHDLNVTNKELERDITEQKKLQDIIAQGKREWEETFDVINDAITIHDKDFHILRANTAAKKMLGLSFGEIIGQKCHQLYHGSDSPPEGCASCLALKTGIPSTIETFEPHLGKFLEIKAIPQADENNHIFKLVHVIRDITERKRIEGELNKSLSSLQAVIDSIHAAIYVADMESYEVLLINKYVRFAFGDIRGKKCWETIQKGQTGPCSFCSNSKLIGPDGTLRDTYIWEIQNTLNGRWYECRDKAIRWIDGRLVRLEIATDITGRKKMEDELLTVQKLESVGILAGGIAHDFNNLLQVIMGNISLAKSYLKPHDNIFEMLNNAEEASEAAKELSFRLLVFSKGGDPVKKIASVGSVLRKAVGLSMSGSNVACDLVLPDDLYPVEIDEGQVIQVFNNILINAREAMPRGGTVTVSAKNIFISESEPLPLEAGDYVRVSLQDRGTGIPEENLSKIFDPYFSTKDMGSQKGTGLGLSISLAIVKKHGGHISVESQEGEGTTVHIFIPASKKASFAGETEKVKRDDLPKKRLLFMDDDERISGLITTMVELLGYEVECARDGEQAIALYRQAKASGETFSAVILDLTVKGSMGGDKVLKRLLEIDPGVRAIISSGYVDDPIMKDFRKYGFVDAIAKPYKIEQLKELLAKL